MNDDDDELNINPPTPCQICKRPPAPKPKENWPAFRESQVEGQVARCTRKSLSVRRFMSFLRISLAGWAGVPTAGSHGPGGPFRPLRAPSFAFAESAGVCELAFRPVCAAVAQNTPNPAPPNRWRSHTAGMIIRGRRICGAQSFLAPLAGPARRHPTYDLRRGGEAWD